MSLKLQIFSLITISVNSITNYTEKEPQKIICEINQENFSTIDTEINNDNILNSILSKKGYTSSEIEFINNNLTQEQIGLLLSTNYINITKYFDCPYFNLSKLNRYINYQKENNIKIEDVIIRVNIGLDNEFYTDTDIIEDPDNLLVLVNKYNQLPSDYVPSDLTSLKCNEKYQLKQDAALSFDNLIENAKLNNINIYPYSAYRSYEYQNKIYNNYVNKDGLELADTYSARPGYSEHQTGLSIDVKSVGYNEITESDYEWLKENAHLYGYIIRYPKNSTDITGYQEEPWHLRYVGIETATKIKELGINFDEYYQMIKKQTKYNTL